MLLTDDKTPSSAKPSSEDPSPENPASLRVKGGRTYLGRTWHLAWPVILENTLATTFGFVDTAMVGSLGAVAISAVALNSSVVYLFNGFLGAVSVGSMVLVAQATGAGDTDKAARLSRQSLGLGLLAGLVAWLILAAISGQLPAWMGGQPAVQPLATAYLRWVSCSYPLFYTGLVLSAVLRGYGDTRTPLRLTLAGNLANIVGNFLLIFPTRTLTFGTLQVLMPGAGLGVAGAAMSTALSQGLTGIALILVFIIKRFPLRYRLHQSFRLARADVRDIFNIGVPAALDRSSHTVGLLIYVRVIASLGTVALAAHQLATTAESLSYMPAIGFSLAATTLVGQSVGARRSDQAVVYGRTALLMGTAVMTILAGLLYLFPEPLIRLITPDPAVISLTVTTLRSYVWCLPLFAVAITASGAMRGAGDTRVPFYFAAAGMWGLRLPLALVAVSVLHLGLPAVWIAMGIDLTFRGLVMGWRFRRRRWLKSAPAAES